MGSPCGDNGVGTLTETSDWDPRWVRWLLRVANVTLAMQLAGVVGMCMHWPAHGLPAGLPGVMLIAVEYTYSSLFLFVPWLLALSLLMRRMSPELEAGVLWRLVVLTIGGDAFDQYMQKALDS